MKDIFNKTFLEEVGSLLPIQLKSATFNFNFLRFCRIANKFLKYCIPAQVLDVGGGVGKFPPL